MHPLARLDLAHHWHPFTQMRDWCRQKPIVIASGRGALLRDVHGHRYLDANASIWTNLHGHNHPQINAALRQQLRKIAHSSALGLANEPAAQLAARLVELANVPSDRHRGARSRSRARAARRAPAPPLNWVFFSDDGSTAMEVALKLAYEYTRRTNPGRKPRFLSLQGAYHGDTVGAVSLGHIDLFHHAYAGLLFPSDSVMAPYCYRCPYNRARPERADARSYRQCQWECVRQVEQRFEQARRRDRPISALVVEPGIQGAAGMIPQPDGWLRRVARIARGHGALIIADEILTGFGRAVSPFPVTQPGDSAPKTSPQPPLFASQAEGVQPDFLALAKGLTGGYLPMAATLTSPAVFEAFLGDYAEFKTFFHGHSYTANQLGAAAALANLELLQSPASLQARQGLARALEAGLAGLWDLPAVGDIRQVGLIAAVELVKDWRTRKPYALRDRVGIKVCAALARRGVLTRPIGNVIVVVPPYCTTAAQVRTILAALHEAISEVRRG
jgi:adenosylmethionine-8-amino-7-oxononanoate aminotransferase